MPKTSQIFSESEMEACGRAWVGIDLSAIQANVRTLRKLLEPEKHLLAVVKANAYGHGLLPVARAAVEAGAAWLGVAAVSEGVALREAGLTASILLLCAPAPGEAETLVTHRLTATVGDPVTLSAIAKAAQKGKSTPEIHLEIDTGMGRSGVQPEEVVAFWRMARNMGLGVTGLTTHFADADAADETFTQQQLAAFQRASTALQAAGARFDWIHLSNSAATLRFPHFPGNLVRPGLLLYGITPPNCADISRFLARREEKTSPPTPLLAKVRRAKVRATLTLKARVATVRNLPAGHAISYGMTHRLTRDSHVATVLIGYGDGYPRGLSNRGAMLLHGRRAPILGRVCMDQTVVDVTDIPGVAPGDMAVCIGVQEAEHISVEEIAALLETTEHEISTSLTARLPRLYTAET